MKPQAQPPVTGAKPARILVVDDHPMVRERLAEAINRERDLKVCGEAEDNRHAMDLIANVKPDMAVIDLSLKGSYGLELLKDIRARHPTVLVLVLSMHEESLFAERAIRAGARGYITKQEATKKIIQAIRRVLGGEFYLGEKTALQLASLLAGHTRPSSPPGIDGLSDRELEVLELIGQGRNTRQVAEKLGVDIKTIETYRGRIKEKLHLKNASELLHFAVQWIYGGAR